MKRRKTAPAVNEDVDVPDVDVPDAAQEKPSAIATDTSEHPEYHDILANDALYQLQDNADSSNQDDSGADAVGPLDLDATTIGTVDKIIDHSERVGLHYAINAADASPRAGPTGLVFVKTGSRMKIESLPILDNLVGKHFQSQDGDSNAVIVFPSPLYFS